MATFLKLNTDYVNASNIKRICEYKVNANQEKYDSWYLEAKKVISEHGNINPDTMFSADCIFASFEERRKMADETMKRIVFEAIGEPPEYVAKSRYKVVTNDDEVYDLDYNPLEKYVAI